MRKLKYLLSISAVMTLFSGVALGQGWRGIEPLHSTRTHVEKLLGPPPSGAGYTYDLENEMVHFQYQNPESECGKTWGYWNVPLDTVLFIIVVPKEKKPLAEFGLDRTYVKSHTCMPGSFNYSNEDKGITYSVTRDVVTQIGYTPTLKDRRRFSCPRE